jgi:hypothetical protein
MAQEQQLITAAEEVEADDFDAMMSALDLMFHVHECPNHSGAERLAAYARARQAFAAYCGFEPDDMVEDELTNAPTSNKVH